jgi:hypothetical protein
MPIKSREASAKETPIETIGFAECPIDAATA